MESLSSSGGTNQHTSLIDTCPVVTQDKARHSFSKVLLVDVADPNSNKSVRCYAILDEQSSVTFIIPKLCNAHKSVGLNMG